MIVWALPCTGAIRLFIAGAVGAKTARANYRRTVVVGLIVGVTTLE